MAVIRKWEFRSKFRTNAYGWRGSSLAISRLKDAVAEIRAVAKLNPVLAGDGIVTLAERIWPAFQGIDTSSGALGSAIYRTLNDLIPLLIAAPADQVTRGKWLARLYEAVQNDGVEYLSPLEERWGEIAQYRDFMDDYANRLIGLIRQAWSTDHEFAHINGVSICLSCLLERGRYDELQELLAIHRRKFWPWHKYGAEALVRQGMWEAARAFAEDARSTTNPGFYETSIDRFCEALLINQGRRDEAYRSYGLGAANGTTNLAIYRSLIRAYPERDPRQVLLDLIETRGDKGKWFAAAKDAGFFDIAIACAGAYGADPSTLVRAARDFQSKEPKFAATVALLVLSSLLNGGGYDPRPSEASDALNYLVSASREIGAAGWALVELEKLAAQRCTSGRESFQEVIKTILSQLKSSETNF